MLMPFTVMLVVLVILYNQFYIPEDVYSLYLNPVSVPRRIKTKIINIRRIHGSCEANNLLNIESCGT